MYNNEQALFKMNIFSWYGQRGGENTQENMKERHGGALLMTLGDGGRY